jgi:spore germination cell wall hydrolase CwlJ-like protein
LEAAAGEEAVAVVVLGRLARPVVEGSIAEEERKKGGKQLQVRAIEG